MHAITAAQIAPVRYPQEVRRDAWEGTITGYGNDALEMSQYPDFVALGYTERLADAAQGVRLVTVAGTRRPAWHIPPGYAARRAATLAALQGNRDACSPQSYASSFWFGAKGSYLKAYYQALPVEV